MNTPQWFREAVAVRGARVQERALTEEQAVAELAHLALTKDDEFAYDILKDFARRQISKWSKRHLPNIADEPNGQGDLFPELPGWLETGIGKRTHQAVMTRGDWNSAVKQSRTKANNAGGHADAIEAAADRVLPYFLNDEETTAEVMARAGLLAAMGGA